jgi:hypothetical protein
LDKLQEVDVAPSLLPTSSVTTKNTPKNAQLTRHHVTSAMQTPDAPTAAVTADDHRPDRGYVARLSGMLAALLGQAASAELSEDGLLGGLRAAGLITYPPSPLTAEGLSLHHLVLVNLSGALAAELAGPDLPNAAYPFQLNFNKPCPPKRCEIISHFTPQRQLWSQTVLLKLS